LKGTASGYAAQLAWTDALLGDPAKAAEHVKRALALSEGEAEGPGTIPRFRAAAALAAAGMSTDALALVTGAEHAYPEATFVRTVLAPVTRAAIALRQHNPDEAVKALEAAIQTELGTIAGLVPSYLRAEAYMEQGAVPQALQEYQKVTAHRGVDPFAPTVALAYLGIARAHARSGNVDASRRAYEELFGIWQHADADFAPLAAARAEYGRLAQTTTRP
jgi:tetratricopeptide (TPR) repeat protein